MEMSAFVYSGEFATSCVCRPPRGPQSRSDDTEEDAEVVAAAAGVVDQTRRIQSERRQDTTRQMDRLRRPTGQPVPRQR
jgi:hypothetical protein